MAVSQKFLIVRGIDLLVVGVHWESINQHLGGGSDFEEVFSSGKIVLTFPPQSIAEEKLTGPGPQFWRARLAGPSRVEFGVLPDVTIELNAEGLLRALLLPGTVMVSDPAAPEDATAIELPWGLVITARPREGSLNPVSDHSPRPVLSPEGVSGLWWARLRAQNGSATDARLALLPVSVRQDPQGLNIGPPSDGDRLSILSLSAGASPELRQLADVKRLELSALGGSFSARGLWPGFEWDHDTTLGRDQRVRVLSRGVLYPFGHRAEFQELAERVMDTENLPPPDGSQSFAVAGMRKDLLLVITEPVRKAVGDERLAREFPFADVEILTHSFRDLKEPNTQGPWEWVTFPRTPIAPESIRQAIEAVEAELGPLVESVQAFLDSLPQTFAQMFDPPPFGSAADLLHAQSQALEFDPEGLQQTRDANNERITILQGSFLPETTTGPDGETVENPGAVEHNQAVQAEISQLSAENQNINQILPGVIAQRKFWDGEVVRLNALVFDEFNKLPRNLEMAAKDENEAAQQALILQGQLAQLRTDLEEFNAAKAQNHDVFFTPHTSDGNPLMFPVRCRNALGDIYFSLPLIFVKDMTLPGDENFEEFRYLDDQRVIDALRDAWQARSAVPLPGVRLNPLQRLPGPPPRLADIQEVHQITISGSPHGGTFRPSMPEFLVELPTLRTLLPNQPERVALKLRDEFLNVGESVELALAPVKEIGIDFTELPERSGGLISPKYTADVISRELGPVARAALPDIDLPTPDLSSVFKEATLLGFSLGDLIEDAVPIDLKDPKGLPKIVPVMVNGLPAGARMEWKDLRLKDHSALRVKKGVTKFELTVERSPANTETTCTLSDFSLVMPPSGTPLVELTFKSVVFTQKMGQPPDLDINGLGVEFHGALKLLKKLQDEILPLIGISGPKPSIDVTKSGITAKYAFHVPRVTAGAFLLKNIAFLIAMEVPFTKKPVTVSLGFASRENPFALTVLMFGGGGYIDVQVCGDRISRLEASLEFGAMVEIDLVIARGEVHALGGVHFVKQPDGSMELEAYIRIGGSVEVLGLVSVSVELVVMLTYKSEPENRLVGRATLVIEIDVTFFSEAVTLDSGEYVLAGSDTPRPAPARPRAPVESGEDPGLAAWRQARRAYAEATS